MSYQKVLVLSRGQVPPSNVFEYVSLREGDAGCRVVFPHIDDAGPYTTQAVDAAFDELCRLHRVYGTCVFLLSCHRNFEAVLNQRIDALVHPPVLVAVSMAADGLRVFEQAIGSVRLEV
ncbi:MAG: hypothetical protein LR017_02610 [Candidatus Pacebacteria bacterium]|nr:hypothetical protein [Candidatus Paceibacterota bacterium]